MQKRFSKFLAGLLSVAIVLSSGSYTAFAGAVDPAQVPVAGEQEPLPEQSIAPEEDQDIQIPEETVEAPEQTEDTEYPDVPEGEEQAGSPAEGISENTEEGGEENREITEITDEETAAQAIVSVNGVAEVRIIAGVPVEPDHQFTVELLREQTVLGAQDVTLNTVAEGVPAEGTARFPELETGTYELRISGGGFMVYSQEVPVTAGKKSRIQVYTGKVVTGTEENGIHPGLMFSAKGDVTGDGALDGADSQIIIDTIEELAQKALNQDPDAEAPDLSEEEALCDINGDNKVDLLDLNYLTEAMEMARTAQKSSVEVLVPRESVDTLLIGGKVVSSNEIQSLFTRDGTKVEVAPAKADEPLSEDNPAVMEFNFHESAAADMGGIVIGTPGDNTIVDGTVEVEYADGEKGVIQIKDGRPVAEENRAGAGEMGSLNNNNGMLCINLKGMVAVKKVTFRITKTSSEKLNLAEISTVEFLNDMEKRIPEPEMNIPKNLKAVPGNQSFSVSWGREPNVTRYEVRVRFTPENEDGTKQETQEEYIRTTVTSLDVSQFNKSKLKNYVEYEVAVQSLNGEWKSGFSEPVTVMPEPTAVPPKPDYVSVKGSYRNIAVSWKKMDDAATGFYLYYKKAEEDDTTYKEIHIPDGSAASYIIDGLEDNVRYEVYLIAYNELGNSLPSLHALGRTLAGLDGMVMPKYKLLNTSNGEGVLSNHIISAKVDGPAAQKVRMVDSPLDEEGTKSALGLFDNNPASYAQCEDWDWGVSYPGSNKGVFIELDGVYSLGMLTFYEPLDKGGFSGARVSYQDADGKMQVASNTSIVEKRTPDNRKYFLVKFDEIKTSKIQFSLSRGHRLITIADIQLHKYDSLEKDILDLYTDDLQITLKDTVTEATLENLQKRLNTRDPESGEYHPEKDALQKDLDAAVELWKTKSLGGVLEVNPRIRANGDVGVGGLNPWQPLGIAAAAGEELIVYVGNPGQKRGQNARVSLVFTQYHSEAGAFFKAQNLKIGRNQVIVPEISSTDVERGGALYIQYNGSSDKDKYAVRVSGGGRFPVLNVYGVSREERTAKIQTYVNELREYSAKIQEEHGKIHAGSGNENIEYDYDSKNCILNSTDIVMDQMMLSIPASQALAGLGTGSAEDQAACLTRSIQSMEDMLILFYQHKGLSDKFKDEGNRAKNHLPYRYLNIRYMRMFAGAFMYASGNHIGIEWPETRGMTGNNNPVISDENGKYKEGRYFGWGIAHEIGHDINQGAYAHAEVTNNYFSVLAQAKDANNSVRFVYRNVFDKVTSGTQGPANNVFTQLGMYWQLHLAYDNDYNYKTYETYEDTFDNLFFARVDSYARDTSKAPVVSTNGNPGMALTLPGDRDQNLMRLASAAAQKDLSEFFKRWGMVPTGDTEKYMSQFPKEERAVYYGDDTARVYRIEGGSDEAIAGKSVVTATVSVNNTDVALKMELDPSVDKNSLQGYEITRVYLNQGKEQREIAGFTQGDTFEDQVPFAANRVITYEVTAIGKCMNRSNVFRADPVKIEDGDGLLDKSSWTVTTNMSSEDDQKDVLGEDGLECEITDVPAIDRVLNRTETYTGKADAADPYILLELHENLEVNSLSYKLKGAGNAITDYKIEVSSDGNAYINVKEGAFALKDGKAQVYFENEAKDPWICTYDVSYVKLTAVGQAGKEISIDELDLYGPSGDNVDFVFANDNETVAGIGTLSENYVFDRTKPETASANMIPKGSTVFYGKYRGNPAYNVVVLYDDKGNIVGGVNEDGDLIANQIVLAEELTREDAMLGNTSEGRWIYWIEPGNKNDLPGKVRAELYRVDNALTNEGQRLVSDTKFVELPAELPPISIEE